MTTMAEKIGNSRRSNFIKNVIGGGVVTAFFLGARGDAHAPQVDHPDSAPVGETFVLPKPLDLHGWRSYHEMPKKRGGQASRGVVWRGMTEVSGAHMTDPAVTARRDEVPTEARPVSFNWFVAPFVAAGVYSLSELARGILTGNKKAGLRGTLGMTIASALACGAMTPTPASSEAPLPTPIVQPTTAPETATSPAPSPTETLQPPENLVSAHPDFSHPETLKNVAFTEGITVDLAGGKPINELLEAAGLPKDAAVAYAGNIAIVREKVGGGTMAKVFYTSDYLKNFVLVGGPRGVAVIAAGNTYSYHPNAEWFSFQPAEAPAYTWVDPGVPFDQIVGGYVGEYPVWGIANQKETGALPSSVFAPDSGEFVPLVEPFRLDSVGLSPEQLAAMKKHAGLEASITRTAEGTFTAQAMVLSPEGVSDPAPLEVDPATLTENLALIGKNKYADTPVMTTKDGTMKLYWIQEYQTWYAKTLEKGSIHAPRLIPDGKPEISSRMLIVDHPEDFSQAAVERWGKHQYQNALGFQWREVNHNTGEGKKFGYLDNMSMGAPDLTVENSPVQVLADDWYAMKLPDGTLFRFFALKWLDPKDPRNPQPDEWKIILVAPGTEITENEQNRKQFMKEITALRGNAPVRYVMPIFKADEGFFEFPNLPTALPIPQPSLAKLLNELGDEFINLPDPNLAKYNSEHNSNLGMGYWVNYGFDQISNASPSYLVAMENSSEDYYDSVFPQEIQTLIFPAFVMLR